MGLLFVTEFIGWEPPGGRRLGWSLYISDSHIEMGICASKFFVFCVFIRLLVGVYGVDFKGLEKIVFMDWDSRRE